MKLWQPDPSYENYTYALLPDYREACIWPCAMREGLLHAFSASFGISFVRALLLATSVKLNNSYHTTLLWHMALLPSIARPLLLVLKGLPIHLDIDCGEPSRSSHGSSTVVEANTCSSVIAVVCR